MAKELPEDEETLKPILDRWVRKRLSKGATEQQILSELDAMSDVANLTATMGAKLGRA